MMDTRSIEWVEIDSIEPYHKNPRKNDKAVARVAQSIDEFGFNQPIVVDADRVIVVGHTRHKAAKELGMTQVPILFMPEHVEAAKVRAYRIADNKLNELAEWDEEVLVEELQDLVKELPELDLTGYNEDSLERMLHEVDEQYTKKVDTPIYTVQGDEPELHTLYDDTKTRELIEEIDRSDAPEDIKEFLRLASYRHTQFNYDRIAEYYAHAEADTQRLIENNVLVIIDFESAIEKGYTTLRDEIADLYLESKDAQE